MDEDEFLGAPPQSRHNFSHAHPEAKIYIFQLVTNIVPGRESNLGYNYLP